jgi:hypothetical protein
MVFGPKTPKNEETLAWFKHKNNDQQDQKLFPYVKKLLSPTFNFYPKSVTFNGRENKNMWRSKKTPQAGSNGATLMYRLGACRSTFYRVSMSRDEPDKPHVAFVEGQIGRIPGAIVSPEWEFHCCVVIVDHRDRSVYIVNPWQLGTLRSPQVNKVSDIRVRLVMNLVRMYHPNWKYFHISGKQVSTSDCRIHCLKFVTQLAKIGREFKQKMDWKELENR